MVAKTLGPKESELMSKKKHSLARWVAFTAVLGSVAYSAGRATADGIPVDEPLNFGGMLLEDGRAITGSRDVSVTIWRDSEASDDTQVVCTVEAPGTTVNSGSYRVAMPMECADAMRDETDLWSQLTVDGTMLARQKVGAVPFVFNTDVAALAGDAEFADRAVDDFSVGQNLTVSADLTTSAASLNRVKAASLRVGNDVLVADDTGVRVPSLARVERFSSESLQLDELTGRIWLSGYPAPNASWGASTYTNARFTDTLVVRAPSDLSAMNVTGNLFYDGPTQTQSVQIGGGAQWITCEPGVAVGIEFFSYALMAPQVANLTCTVP